MKKLATIRKWALGFGLLVFTLASVSFGSAQVNDFGKHVEPPVTNQAPPMLKKVKVTQNLNAQVPLDLTFRDETGKTVKLGDYFGKRPVILGMVYYKCKMLCPEEINGLVGALEMVKFNPGKDFNIVFVSFDPTETPQIAAQEKAVYMKRYGRPADVNGWHFLTGQQAQINALASATGYHFERMPGPDGKMDQFAHASAIEILTPTGKISQYYLGVEYAPKDLQLGLVEASDGKIGSLVDNILTYCYRYNPLLDRHDLIIARVLQAACLLTLLLLGTYMGINFRRDIRNGRSASGKTANG
ncbi:MAG: SCO family protein [Acidobacteriaceae bacterium]